MIPYSVPVETLLKHAWEIGTWRNRPTCFFISSPPRAGSTWVLEAIERHVYARRHYEPVRGLLTDPPPAGRGLSGLLRPAVEHEPDDTLKRRFAAVLDNAPPTTMKRARSAKLTLAANLGRIIDPEFTVLKFVALSRSLPWIARNFDCRGLIILRSPLGLVASAKEMHDRHPGWSAELVETSYPRTFLELVPELKRFKQVNHIQQMALNYCIDLFFSVASQEAKARYSYLLYENALHDPACLTRAARFLSGGSESIIKTPGIGELSEASTSTYAGSRSAESRQSGRSTGDRLTAWEAEQVMDVSQAVLGELFSADGSFNPGSPLSRGLNLI